MKGLPIGPLIGFVLLLLLLSLGMYQLFDLQFSDGEGYAPGSTLRADLEGSMIFYEGLEKIDDLDVMRNADLWERTLEDLDPETTRIFMLNKPRRWLWAHQELSDFVREGGTVIVSMKPTIRYASHEKDEDEDEDADEDEEEESPAWEKDDFVPLDLTIPDLIVYGDPTEAVILTVQKSSALTEGPDEIRWAVRQTFLDTDMQEHEFNSLYDLNGKALVIEKTFEKGQVIFLADSQLLLNEAMYKNRQSEWLAWLIEDAKTVIFEERYFGLSQPRGLAALMWRYRLQGMVFGLGLPFLLLLWHGAVPLLPSLAPEEEIDTHQQSRLSGFRDLLARYIPAKEILPRCVDEWRKSFLHEDKEQKRFQALLEETQKVLDEKTTKKPSELSNRYQQIHKILNQKRTGL